VFHSNRTLVLALDTDPGVDPNQKQGARPGLRHINEAYQSCKASKWLCKCLICSGDFEAYHVADGFHGLICLRANNKVGIERMNMKSIMAALAVTLAGCALAGDTLVSEWSTSSNGLKIQVLSPTSFSRRDGWAQLEVTCVVTNVGTTATNVSHLSRLFLVDGQGTTNRCGRHEDTMDMTPARPTITAGQATSWKQDGGCKVKAGVYRLFAVWDRDKDLRSPAIEITVK
jgi:hypothetical protein